MILWFRNDLRIHDNPALTYALEQGVKQAVFFIPTQQWHQHLMAPIKADFILRHVSLLKQQLTEFDITLNVIEVSSFNEQATWLINYCQQHHCDSIIANKELEINEVLRDQGIAKQINLTLFESDVIVPKGRLLNKTDAMYKVFTPFKKAWLEYVKYAGFDYIPKYALDKYKKAGNAHSDASETSSLKCDFPLVDSSKWPLSDAIEQHVIPEFLQNRIGHYAEHRDIPGIKGTSGLSAYFAIGAISVRYILTLLVNRYPDLLNKSPENAFSWLNELIWREFYRHLLWHFPQLNKGYCFNEKYQKLPWLNEQAKFLAWKTGNTGYPLVDAAMRQLNTTGWMHNRLRMVVASFLTKHLLIDWRWGQDYFSETLIDADLAANNGGWQWSAGTGCDAQPYFRVFNPITQSERFDPSGNFIRKYLPELNDIPDKNIHFPHKYIEQHKLSCYWPAIVEHKSARLRAIDFYKSSIS